MKKNPILFILFSVATAIGFFALVTMFVSPLFAPHVVLLKANSFCVSLPNTDHAWDLSDRHAVTMGNDSTPIEILVTTSEEARDQANNVERMLTGKSVALDLARQDGYVAFKVVGNDDRLFVTSPLNITK